jgi:hypothetical protein
MILMRWANVVASSDPRTSATLSQRADQLASPLPPSRLHAAIARQRANVAAVLGDRAMFDAQVERARDYAATPVTDGELTPYADRAYVASEQADGLLVLAEPERAAAILAEHVHTWAAGQERDHAVALARWLHALAASGDCRTALDHSGEALLAYGRAPSVRSRSALQAIIRMRPVGDRLHHIALRGRIAATIEGTTSR